MAVYKEVIIPEVNKKYKVVTNVLQFTGEELDKGKGRIVVSFLGREINPLDDSEVIGADGNPVYSSIDQTNINADLLSELDTVINGISGAQVLEWLAKWVDSKLS